MRPAADLPRHSGISVAGLMALLPAVICLGSLFAYPVLLTARLSFTPEGGSGGWTLQHYTAFLGGREGWRIVGLTFGLATTATLVSAGISVPFGLAVRRRVPGYRLVRGMVLIPLVVPHLIAALGLLLFWDQKGWGNQAVSALLPFLSGPLRVNYTWPGVVLSYVWIYFPYTALLTMAGFEAVDPNIEEAAEVCGASHFFALRRVILPLVTPHLLAGSVLTFVQCFGAFSVPLVVGGNYRPLAVQIYTQAAVFQEWSAASALAVVMGVVQVVFLTVYVRVTKRGGR